MILIANPIYDTVFKRLMENERVARFFIKTLLNREVASVKMLPQEFTYYKKKSEAKAKTKAATKSEAEEQLTIFRLDFMATIVTSTGERMKVLIEVQKAKDETDLMRFRSYLGEQYRKSEQAGGKKTPHPIITIYVLGFELPEIPTACVKVGRVYEDMINNVPIHSRSPFIEQLTHDSYVVQVTRITERYQTPLDRLLSIFEQAHFVGDTEAVKHYTYDPDDADVKAMTDILHHVGTDPAERKALDIEVEANRTFEEWLGKRYDEQRDVILDQGKKLQEAVGTISEQGKELQEKDKKLQEKDKKLQAATGTISEQGKKLQEAAERIAALERLLSSK
jgi:hypothetical protein